MKAGRLEEDGAVYTIMFGLIGFMLGQFEIARSVQLRPYNATGAFGPIAIFVPDFSRECNVYGAAGS